MVVHCATQGTRGKDVVSANNLIAAARRTGVDNIIYVSIVGIDRIPMGYYKAKLRVEEALAASGLGHTIIRVTQFHDLIETMFAIQRFSPALFAIRGVRFQPIDTRDVATHLVSLIDDGPAGVSTTSADPPYTTTTNSGGCIWPHATAADGWWLFPCPAASSQV